MRTLYYLDCSERSNVCDEFIEREEDQNAQHQRFDLLFRDSKVARRCQPIERKALQAKAPLHWYRTQLPRRGEPDTLSPMDFNPSKSLNRKKQGLKPKPKGNGEEVPTTVEMITQFKKSILLFARYG